MNERLMNFVSSSTNAICAKKKNRFARTSFNTFHIIIFALWCQIYLIEYYTVMITISCWNTFGTTRQMRRSTTIAHRISSNDQKIVQIIHYHFLVIVVDLASNGHCRDTDTHHLPNKTIKICKSNKCRCAVYGIVQMDKRNLYQFPQHKTTCTYSEHAQFYVYIYDLQNGKEEDRQTHHRTFTIE